MYKRQSLGSRTVQTGYISKGKDNGSQSLQMMERPLMTADELKSMPKGQFIVMKTGTHPMKVKLKLFFQWGISFGAPYTVPDKGNRPVAYAGKEALVQAIQEKCWRREIATIFCREYLTNFCRR